jgi:hypothetical protein
MFIVSDHREKNELKNQKSKQEKKCEEQTILQVSKQTI